MAKDYLFTSESVSEGHPDKVSDQISDAVVDALLAQDPHSRIACETMVNTGMAIISGEITTKAVADFPEIVRNTVREAIPVPELVTMQTPLPYSSLWTSNPRTLPWGLMKQTTRNRVRAIKD